MIFVKQVTSVLMAGQGHLLPVSALPVDGSVPTGTATYEKRSIAKEIPIWDPDDCTGCGVCTMSPRWYTSSTLPRHHGWLLEHPL